MIGQGKTDPPRVSVITIFYDAEPYLREAIDSALAQDFGDFELLLVDDGSTDESSAIAKDYAARDSRVRYLEHPGHSNRGMSATRNVGLAQARGELVAFLDADDRWRPWKLRKQVELLDRLRDVDVVGGAVNYWSSHGGGKDRIVPTAHVRNRPIGPAEATLALYPLGKADAPSMSDLMFRRSSVSAVGGFEESFWGAYEDQAFLAKIYLSSTLYFTDEVWSDYRLHADSCMAEVNRNGTYPDARRAFLKWFDRFLKQSPHRDDMRIRRALDRALRLHRTKAERLSDAVRAIPYAVPLVRAARATVKRLRPLVAPGPAILMYHRIANASFDPWALSVSPSLFREQMEWLARSRTVLPLVEFAQLHAENRLPRDSVAVTFDDGYACSSKVALPILEEFGIPATIFLPADLIQRGQEFWWDELERIVLNHAGESLRLNGHVFAVGEKQAGDSRWAAALPPATPRQVAYRELWSVLHKRRPKELEKGIEQLREQAQVPNAPRDSHRPMTCEEVRSIRSGLIEFGSHSLNHAALPLLSRQEKAREICESLERCAEITGARPQSFAYPYGEFDRESEQLVAQAGFHCACKAEGWFVRRGASRFALPRIFVGNWTSAGLMQQLGAVSRAESV